MQELGHSLWGSSRGRGAVVEEGGLKIPWKFIVVGVDVGRWFKQRWGVQRRRAEQPSLPGDHRLGFLTMEWWGMAGAKAVWKGRAGKLRGLGRWKFGAEGWKNWGDSELGGAPDSLLGQRGWVIWYAPRTYGNPSKMDMWNYKKPGTRTLEW